ncbi:MAG: hypothetical protein IM638_19445 [Bacteroidetes bacterium]|nr:hypothetical protein [Bacteroidota bacterium]
METPQDKQCFSYVQILRGVVMEDGNGRYFNAPTGSLLLFLLFILSFAHSKGIEAFPNFRTVAAADGFTDVVIHFKNGAYVAEVETAGQLVETSVAQADLAAFMNGLPAGEVRLLACNSLEEAKLLSRMMTRPLVVSDGWVKLYADGSIASEGAFVRLQGGNVVANLGVRVSMSTGAFVRLGDDGVNLLKVVLGTDNLSQFAISFRRTLSVPNHRGNVAVFEYWDNNGILVKKAFTTDLQSNLHAEELALIFFNNQNISLNNISRIYSELEPCALEGHSCKSTLILNCPNAQIKYSYDYPGGNNASPEVINIRRNSINQRETDLNTKL